MNVPMSRAPRRIWMVVAWVVLLPWLHPVRAAAPAALVTLDPPSTVPGYLASLLINESPFPGERGYESEADSKAAMLAILWVLHARINYIPPGYSQEQVAAVRSRNVIDVITAGGEKGQCDGFYRDGKGRFVSVPRVQQRRDYLVNIANKSSEPGRFARLLLYGRDLARAYVKGGIEGADRFAGLTRVKSYPVTGRAYSWMTDRDYYKPGGYFIAIPDVNDGSLGGNRFFTLRKDPK
jgi:hypothetical protein